MRANGCGRLERRLQRKLKQLDALRLLKEYLSEDEHTFLKERLQREAKRWGAELCAAEQRLSQLRAAGKFTDQCDQ